VAIPTQEISAERALESWVEPGADADAGAQSAATTVGLRIRQLELVGFKSFRDRTILRFPVGVTGVVGPNGCGKSNVVDAIRWVLGEQSAKRLRGDGMEDVIFAGNDRHAPLGMAQVSIVFESDGLPGDQTSLLRESGHPLASGAVSEIMVTRRYLRSGESEYMINGVPCRLRDITELFLGTGVGTKAYAIIEQGRVEQLISAKPDELRLFIEEAAGTTLYRSRRQMAERKMERTQDNLLRVQDILREVDRQLGGLRRQAKRAEQYRVLQAEIATLDVAASARQRARLAAELAAVEAEHGAAVVRHVELSSAIEERERERRGARQQEAAVRAAVQDANGAAFAARSAADSCRHELGTLHTRARELTAHQEANQRELDAAATDHARAQADHASAEAALIEEDATIVATETRLAEQETSLAAAREAQHAAAERLEQTRIALVDALADESRARNALATVAERRRAEHGRLERAEGTAAGLRERERAGITAVDAAGTSVLELQRTLAELEGVKRDRAEAHRHALADRAQLESVLDGLRERLARARSRRDSLREIEDSRAAYGEGVRAVLAATSREDALGLVAEVLDIPAEYERAVAAALGDRLQSVITRDHETAREAVQALRRAGAGRASCILASPRTRPSDPLPAGGRRLLDLVEVRPGYDAVAQALLGNVVLIDDLAAAMRVWSANGAHRLLVTQNGETLDETGTIAGGSEPAEQTLLAQRRELRALDVEVRELESELAEARARHEAAVAAVALRETDLQAVDGELGQVTVALVASEKDGERARHELHEVRQQLSAIGTEITAAQMRLAELESDALRLAGELAASDERRSGSEVQVAAAESALAAAQSALAAVQDALTRERIAAAEQRARRDGLIAMMDRVRRSADEAQRRMAMLDERRRVDAATLAQIAADTVTLGARLTQLDADVERRAIAVTEADAALAAVGAAVEAAEKAIATAQAESEAVRVRISSLEVQTTERRLAIAHLDELIRDRYGKDLASEDPGEESNEQETVERVAQLRQRVAAMGEVNVAALSEVAELEERQQFLATQRADLEGALEDLRKTITQLNRTSRSRFRDTFERVDQTFREVFPKLFHGGKASLRLTDDQHPLDSGVEIVVQPPGKRVGSLDLLSGGEKALTAVSLIFALFLIKPSPFCFLDEVDAPLDDANIGRFNAMVREMSGMSQFILITHNKRTMEVAETLYGITMEEPGVSKVVSVRLPD
jgi:chromosome segregation protein